MKKAVAPTLILAGLVLAGTAQANPYGHWQSSVSDDDVVRVADSFNSTAKSSVSEENDITVGIDKRHSEDNDITTSYRSSEDNDVSSWYRSSEDNDISSYYSHAEDNDVSEDNDYTHTEDNDTDVDVDFQIATPTLTSYKYQSRGL